MRHRRRTEVVASVPMRCVSMLLVACAVVPASGCAELGPWTLTAPGGRVCARVVLDDTAPQLAITLDDRPLVRCAGLGLLFADAPALGGGLEVVDSLREVRREEYELPLGERRPCVDHHRGLVLTLRERAAPHRSAELHVRVHDDGVAYRWRVLDWPGCAAAAVTAEQATHTVSGNPRVFPLYRAHFRTSHEGPYTKTHAAGLEAGRLIDLPLLLAQDDGRCAAFTEADVRGYPHSYLERTGTAGTVALRQRLSPRHDDPSIAARVTLPFQTPWRVWTVGDAVAELLESDLLTDLCPPSRIAEPGWIGPGKQTWHWWNGTVLDETRGGGMDYATMRAYIDFCADNGIRYHAITGQDVPWYVQSRRSVLPGPDSDVLTPRPELRWPELLAHARERGVELRLWVHWRPLRPVLEAALQLYARWGIRGLMVDFLDRDDQDMVEFCERVVALAAQHRMTVQFHGSFKPTGLRRTWPNLVNHEGSWNLEVLKWAAGCDPDHDLMTVFTRGLAGPLDYHLGGFRAAPRDGFRPQYLRPRVLGTRARALAYYVVLHNPLPMVCDYPAAYRDQPGFDFLRDVPTTWDQSEVLAAGIGTHVVWARRHGGTWYLGALTDWSPRELELPLDFLAPGRHRLRHLADAPAGQDPDSLVETRREVTAGDTIRLRLVPGGGAAAVITPIR